MKSNHLNIIAFLILAATFVVCFSSSLNDCWTFDETAHIAAGYSYLSQQDYRLNPEHPPLIKDIAAFPLLFSDLNFPRDHSSWIQAENPVWWLQFDFASQFLYQSGNNPDQIMLLARTSMILVLLFLIGLVFFWCKKNFGQQTALLSLVLMCLSPTLLAHGRLVTTDVGAALGVVMTIFFWLRLLKKPQLLNIILAAVILGISLLFKFSLVLLIPFLAIITLMYAWVKQKSFIKYSLTAILVGLIALILVIWPIYYFHTFNYPIQQQVKDTTFNLENSSAPEIVSDILIWMSSQPVLRAISQYFTGFIMVASRTAGGNTTFFLGQISAESWKTYFPVVYLIKVPLSFHLLTLIALGFFINSFRRKKNIAVKQWIAKYFPEISIFLFIVIYWAVSIKGNLNIGIRHLLPVFPLTIILVSRFISFWLKKPYLKTKYLLLGLIIFWQFTSIVRIYPHFLAYFNQLTGGPTNGYQYVTDSNLDWGQDLRRLASFVEKNKIESIYLNYFGGGSPEYYLGSKYHRWDSRQDPNQLPANSYLAVSVNELQGGRAIPVKGFDGGNGYYQWLNQYKPIAVIGYSIFVYYIP